MTTFWATLRKIWATFYSNIWSHFLFKNTGEAIIERRNGGQYFKTNFQAQKSSLKVDKEEFNFS